MMHRVFVLLVFVSLFSARSVTAQTAPDSLHPNVHADPGVFALVEKRKAVGIKNLKGYRVKIHFGGEKAKANDVKVKFCQKYPDTPAYMDYDTPNFSITVGNFRTRLEAYKIYKEIQGDFPNAFIVEMKIEYPDLTIKKEETPEEEKK
jgi:hypothetical protein